MMVASQCGILSSGVLLPDRGFVTLSAFSSVNVAGNRRHAVADAPAQVRNEPARSSLKCGRRSR